MLTCNIFAFDTKTASLIFERIFSAVFSANIIPVYSKDKEYQEVINSSSILQLAADANIIIVSKYKDIPINTNKIIFTTNAKILETNKYVIGAFYWERGQPKIIFVRDRLKYFNLEVDNKFNKYVVDSLWNFYLEQLEKKFFFYSL